MYPHNFVIIIPTFRRYAIHIVAPKISLSILSLVFESELSAEGSVLELNCNKPLFVDTVVALNRLSSRWQRAVNVEVLTYT